MINSEIGMEQTIFYLKVKLSDLIIQFNNRICLKYINIV